MTAHDPHLSGPNLAGDGLFRTEAVAARKVRLEGEVILAAPVRSSLLALLLLAVAIAAAAWVGLGRYTRSEVARGILVTT